jgi:hypothetical protein
MVTRTPRTKTINCEEDLLAEFDDDEEDEDEEVTSIKAKIALKAQMAKKISGGAAKNVVTELRQLTFDAFAFVACIQFTTVVKLFFEDTNEGPMDGTQYVIIASFQVRQGTEPRHLNCSPSTHLPLPPPPFRCAIDVPHCVGGNRR